jgi:hypothetical protein
MDGRTNSDLSAIHRWPEKDCPRLDAGGTVGEMFTPLRKVWPGEQL